MHRLTDGHHAK